jgi:hypothetical protein
MICESAGIVSHLSRRFGDSSLIVVNSIFLTELIQDGLIEKLRLTLDLRPVAGIETSGRGFRKGIVGGRHCSEASVMDYESEQ